MKGFCHDGLCSTLLNINTPPAELLCLYFITVFVQFLETDLVLSGEFFLFFSRGVFVAYTKM